MKKLNQHGSLAVVIIIILAAIIIAGGGYFVFNRQDADEQPVETQTQQSTTEKADSAKPSESTKEEPKVPNYSIRSISVKGSGNEIIYTATADLNSLPADAPALLKDKLSTDISTSKIDESGCVTGYIIYSYNDVNAYGARATVDPKTKKSSDSCGGGAAAYWYLDDSSWSVLYSQQGIACSTLSTEKIYADFLAECVSDEVNWDKMIPNPNGLSSKSS